MADLIIKNAKLVLPDRIFSGGLVIKDGRITKIAANSKLPKGEFFDAHGKYLLPGLIDSHVHLREPGASIKEDWNTGTCAAAAGGVTTVLDMPNNQPPTTTGKALSAKRKLVAPKARVDYGFHFGASGSVDELKLLKSDVASVKFFMGPTTGDLYAGDYPTVYEELKTLARKKIPATVHAENRDILAYKLKRLTLNKKVDALDYADSRPNMAAAVELSHMSYLAKLAGERMHFCHVSTWEEISVLSKLGNKNVTAEATPHHLFLSREDIKKLGSYSKINPPLRSKEDQAALWKAVRAGLIDTIATDHSPHTREEKEKDILSASAGMPGLETMLPLLLDAVNHRKLTLREVAKLTSQNPAKIFGIKNKGAIKVGYDADLVVVDMKKTAKVADDMLFTKCGWSPFSGRRLSGWPTRTFVRGALVYDGDMVYRHRGREVSYIRNR
jgi:dihydroorotase (multifunctional complex type)